MRVLPGATSLVLDQTRFKSASNSGTQAAAAAPWSLAGANAEVVNRVLKGARSETAKAAGMPNVETINDMQQMDSLRMQMAMDRMSKLMSTLSNIMKKTSDTQNGLTQNLK